MLDWTDRHCRHFHRRLSKHARLYTEMITTGALLYGDAPRHLSFDDTQHPIALQLGGSEPDALAACVRLAARYGYDEVNLNCGCPSERVQRGAFGACLMAEPALVADCVKAMQDAAPLPITVKHRLGVDRTEDYGFVRDFVGTLFEAGCRVFIVHARNAILKGLSPKENRQIPKLRYDEAAQLKKDFPQASIVLNGGVDSLDAAERHLGAFDGVMLGRLAYHDPWVLSQVDARFFGDASGAALARADVAGAMADYIDRMLACAQGLHGGPRAVIRHMLGLYQGVSGARRWRRALSDPAFLDAHGADALRVADRFLGSRIGSVSP